jgi:hypothetical protein
VERRVTRPHRDRLVDAEAALGDQHVEVVLGRVRDADVAERAVEMTV